jgi:hypothetical protein
MIDLHERLATLEERVTNLEEQTTKILGHTSSIDAQLNRYKGFLGAVWFAISCIGVFLSAFKFFHKG